MRTTRIYTAAALSNNTTLALDEVASRHLSRALRLGVGDTLVLFNGQGGQYPAEITAVEKKAVSVRTGEHQAIEQESGLYLHLGIAVSRGERMDLIVQKATELGVNELTPLLTENTQVRLPPERANKKMQHWRQVAISACEQCGRNQIPGIHPLTEFGSWLTQTDAEKKFVLHPQKNTTSISAEPASIALLVGPEGGLSEPEVLAAEQAGYTNLQLGPRVLRTETAPLAAIAILQSHFGDMSLR